MHAEAANYNVVLFYDAETASLLSLVPFFGLLASLLPLFKAPLLATVAQDFLVVITERCLFDHPFSQNLCESASGITTRTVESMHLL